jgi:anti-anti-sigma factor
MIDTQLRSHESIVCTLWGDLDWVGATALRHVMADLLQPGMEVVIDLRLVDSCDAVGISALVGSTRRARAVGCRVRILDDPRNEHQAPAVSVGHPPPQKEKPPRR